MGAAEEDGPNAHSRGGSGGGDEPEHRWQARVVAYGMVLALLFCSIATLEPWPFSSLRLFSGIRTDIQVQSTLVAIDEDGARTEVVFVGKELVKNAASRQVPAIAALPPDEQRPVVRALLAVGDVDPRSVRTVVVHRTVRRLDPDGGSPTVLETSDVVAVDLR